jgi:hypothetical protein
MINNSDIEKNLKKEPCAKARESKRSLAESLAPARSIQHKM